MARDGRRVAVYGSSEDGCWGDYATTERLAADGMLSLPLHFKFI